MLAATLLSFDKFLPIAIFGLFAAVAWWVLEFLASGKPRAEERLDELKHPIKKRNQEGPGAKKTATMTKVLQKASPTLAKPLLPKTAVEAGKIKSRLTQAGFRNETAPSIFLGFKFVGLMAGVFFGGGTVLLTSGATQKALIYTVAFAGFMFYLPDVILWFIGRSRKAAIFFGLPDALDLLVVCVEAGLGLDQAMRKVSEEMKKSSGTVAEEFALCNFQLQVGRARNEVLHELGARTGVDDLRSLAAILIQADKFGSSIAQALRVQSDSMRTRRKQLAEEKAAKTAVKLIFPLVIFIFPAIFVVLVGPAAITIVNEMFPMMQGAK